MVATKSIFNAGHIGALWRKTDYIQGQSKHRGTWGTGTGAISTSISCFTSWLLLQMAHGQRIFNLEMSEDGGSTWTSSYNNLPE